LLAAELKVLKLSIPLSTKVMNFVFSIYQSNGKKYLILRGGVHKKVLKILGIVWQKMQN